MAKKIILIVVGAVLLLCGLAGIVPSALLGRLGAGDAINSGYHSIGTATPALVSQTAQVSDLAGAPGDTTIQVKARDTDQPIFLGVARAGDVDRYLADVAYDEVRDLSVRPYRVETTRHDGIPFADPPTEESFWVASATGPEPTLDWTVSEGDYRLVMMNADGSPGAVAETEIGVRVEGLRGLGVGILVVSSVVALVGLGLLLWGLVTRADRRPGIPEPGGPAGPGGVPGTGGATGAGG